MKKLLLGGLLAFGLVLSGCASKDGTGVDDDGLYGGAGADGADGAQGYGIDDGTAGSGSGLLPDEQMTPEQAAALGNRIIYFEYDSAELTDESRETLRLHADYLAGNSAASARLEGHTDERGSREYNIGLGEQRAQAVRSVLLVQGVSGDQLTTVSFGEERPAVLGSDEETWSLNRRVEIVYP